MSLLDLMNDYDNFIFDLYGTLIDVRTDEWCKATWKKWCRVLDDNNIRHPYWYFFRKQFFEADKRARAELLAKGNCTVPEIDIIEVYIKLFKKYKNPDISVEKINEISYEFRVCSREYIRLFDGVESSLKTLRDNGKKVYILSNAQASYTLPEIKMFKLDELVDDYLMSSDYFCMKPDEKFYNELLNRYGMDKSRTCMFGDSKKNDVDGAINVGINAVHLAGSNASNVFYR